MSAVMGLAPSKIVIVVVASCLALYLVYAMGEPNRRRLHLPEFPGASKSSDAVPATMRPISNSTLGFEKILVLNLPERGDKRDALSLASSLTDMQFDYVDGVRGDAVVNKSLPHGQEERKFPEAMLGSWRAHMNAIRSIVENRHSSALILEDDVDWDVNIKAQMTDFARGTRYLLNLTNEHPSHSPYGDGWDILWLGHCHDILPKKGDNRTFAIPDPAVPRVDQLHNLNNPDLLSPWPPHTRVAHRVGSPICTYAYALSYRGAQKILWSLSVKRLEGLFDNALSWWCSRRDLDGVCLTAHPTYFMQHKALGGPGKNSDNQKNAPKGEKASTPNIRWSARMNIEELLTGQPLHDFYPADGPPHKKNP